MSAGPPPGRHAEYEPQSTASTAKDQATDVAGTAADKTKHVASVAQDQAASVAGEATDRAKELAHQTRRELTDQAGAQQKRVASGLRSLADELGSMADGSQNPGVATDLARQAAERSHTIASWLDDREPGHVLDEVTGFARRRPGAFLAIAAGAGLLAGRLGRGLFAAQQDDSGSDAATPVHADGGVEPLATTTTVGYADPGAGVTPGGGIPPTGGIPPAGGVQPSGFGEAMGPPDFGTDPTGRLP